MADEAPLEPPPPAEPDAAALADRVRRLEAALAARDAAPPSPADDDIARRVLAILAEKAVEHRGTALAAGAAGLIPFAARVVRAASSGDAPPGVAPPGDGTGFKSWFVVQVLGELRLMFRMYFDPRYRISRVAQLGVPAVLGLAVFNYLLFNYLLAIQIPVLTPAAERGFGFVLSVVLYKILAREAVRYKAVLDYLARYG